MTVFEETIAFFLWVGGTYAVGAAVAIYVYYKTGAIFYTSGRAKRERQESAAWYALLRKNVFTPGTVAYGIAWAVGYLLFGYSLWRIWIGPAAHDSVIGGATISVALVHWAALGLNAWMTFGCENLVLGTVGQLLNLGTSGTITALIWKMQVDGTAALIGPGVASAVYAFEHLLAFIVQVALLIKNRNHLQQL